jgi:5'-deoxynucleotidase YfbR-like HD superfamily hydrolase
MTSRPIYPPYPVTTVSGREVYPHAPDPSQIVIEDIAHALSSLCRYAGHTRELYSVAQHSVLVAEDVVRRNNFGAFLHWRALLHDAAEAYVCDLPSPLKQCEQLGNAFWHIEYGVQQAVLRALTPDRWRGQPMLDKWTEEVQRADMAVARAEMRDLFPAGAFAPRHTESDFPTIVPLPPVAARELFLATYHRLRSTP